MAAVRESFRLGRHLFSFGVLLLAAGVLLSGIFRQLDTALAFAPAGAETQRVVVIDAGHGGEDGGAVGVNGVLEKELNLSLARTLADLFRIEGYIVVETRTTDRMLYEEKDKNGHKKRADLANRLALMQAHPGCVFVSIHMNTYPLAGCEGTQVWYAAGYPEAKALARSVQDRVRECLQPDNMRQIKEANSRIYLLHRATAPAILIECGFLSSPAECERLSDAAYRQELALVIFSAIAEGLRTEAT